jgi:hypothetical protein
LGSGVGGLGGDGLAERVNVVEEGGGVEGGGNAIHVGASLAG